MTSTRKRRGDHGHPTTMGTEAEARHHREKHVLFGIIGCLLCVTIAAVAVIVFLILRQSGQIPPSNIGIKLQLGNRENVVARAYPSVDFGPMYPGRSQKEIDQIQRECFNLRYIYAPFVEFRPLPTCLSHVTVTPGGYRSSGTSQPWPPRQEDFVVFCFGGSTTFGYGVANQETTASHLQAILGRLWPDKTIQAYNFGRGYYFSTQERILLEDLVLRGYVPQLAIFLDGLNDFCYWNGEPEFTPTFTQFSAPDLPVPQTPSVIPDADCPAAANSVLLRYRHNTQIAEAIADKYNFKVLFIGQPVPYYQYDRPKDTYPFKRPLDYNKLCDWAYPSFHSRFTDNTLGSHAVWCGDAFLKSDKHVYADSIHYTDEGGGILAETIVKRAVERGLIR